MNQAQEIRQCCAEIHRAGQQTSNFMLLFVHFLCDLRANVLMNGTKGFLKALIGGRYLCSQSSKEHSIEMIGLLGRERNGTGEFEQINVKMEFILV